MWFSWGKKSSSFVCFSTNGGSSSSVLQGKDAGGVPVFADDEEEEREGEKEEKVRGVVFRFLGVAFSFLLRGPW